MSDTNATPFLKWKRLSVRPTVGEFKSRTKTTAMTFRPKPWTYVTASPTNIRGDIIAADVSRFVRGFEAPRLACANPKRRVMEDGGQGKREYATFSSSREWASNGVGTRVVFYQRSQV